MIGLIVIVVLRGLHGPECEAKSVVLWSVVNTNELYLLYTLHTDGEKALYYKLSS